MPKKTTVPAKAIVPVPVPVAKKLKSTTPDVEKSKAVVPTAAPCSPCPPATPVVPIVKTDDKPKVEKEKAKVERVVAPVVVTPIVKTDDKPIVVKKAPEVEKDDTS